MLSILTEMQQVDNKRATAKDDFETFQAETASAQKKCLQLENQRLQKTEALTELELSLRLLEDNHKSLMGMRMIAIKLNFEFCRIAILMT